MASQLLILALAVITSSWALPTSINGRTPRIINGKPVAVNEFEFQVGYTMPLPGEDTYSYCGGSLIDSTHVLTAAHCLHGRPEESLNGMTLYLNTRRLSEDEPDAILRKMKSYVMHPDYVPGNEDYDIAIITLDEAVEGITFVKLPAVTDTYAGETATVVGWGKTSPGGSGSEHLLKTNIVILTNEECIEMTGQPKDDSDICSVSPFTPEDGELANDSCQGDSGGPIVIDGIQVGIVSHGLDEVPCGSPHSIDIDARVSFYLDWIAANSGDDDADDDEE